MGQNWSKQATQRPDITDVTAPSSVNHAASTGPYLREHGQLLGKVHHARDGGGHDLCELAEGLQVHLVAVAGGHHRTLADVVGLEMGGGGGGG